MSTLPELGEGAFPARTPWSTVLAAIHGGDQARAALEALCRAYWPPVYVLVRRRRKNPEDALELTQTIFFDLLRRDLPKADPAQGAFRNYLRTIVTSALSNDWMYRTRPKRDERTLIWIDGIVGEERCRLEPEDGVDVEALFDRAWARCVIDRVLQELEVEAQATGDGEFFRAVRPFLSTGYAGAEERSAICQQFGLGADALRTRLCRWRVRRDKRFCREIAKTVDNPKQLEGELNSLRAPWP